MELVNDFTVSAGVEETWHTLTDLELIAPCMPGAQLTEIEGETYRGLVKIKVGPIGAQFKGQAHFVERDAENHKAVLKADGRDTGGKGNASAMITAQLVEISAEQTKVTVTTDLTITGKVAQFGRGALVDVSDKLLKQFVHNLETTVLAEDAAHHPGTAAAAEAPVVEPAPAATVAATEPSSADETAAPEAELVEPAADVPVESVPEDTGPAAGAPVAESLPAADETAPEPAADTVAAPAEAASTPAAPAATPTIRKIDSKPAEPIDLLETAGAPLLKRLAPLLAVLAVLAFIVRRRRRS